jgi:TonB family protein
MGIAQGSGLFPTAARRKSPLVPGARENFAGAAPGGDGGVFLLPFAISEKAVADWTETVLARIERNWSIPASGRLAFSGRVQITLTVERQGSDRSLVIDDSSVPAPLTQAALHAVQASLPLPPLPENVAAESLAFTFVFAYNG